MSMINLFVLKNDNFFLINKFNFFLNIFIIFRYKIKIEFWTKICQTNFEGTFCLRSTVINKVFFLILYL